MDLNENDFDILDDLTVMSKIGDQEAGATLGVLTEKDELISPIVRGPARPTPGQARIELHEMAIRVVRKIEQEEEAWLR